MAQRLLASYGNWYNFAQLLNFPIRRTLSPNFAVCFGRSRVDTVGCLPVLQRKWLSSVQISDLSSCLTLKRLQSFVKFENSSRCVRKFSSKVIYTHDEHEKGSQMIVNSGDSSDNSDSSSGDDATVSSDSAEEVGSSDKAQPVSDVDVDKELLRYDYEEFELIPDEEVSIVQPVKKSVPVELKRGVTGVFDVEEVVDLLRDEKARDICVIYVPPELKYVSYLVIVTGRTTRHLKAMAAYIKWMYKAKRCSADAPSVKIEGEHTNDWFAIDLGNIAVHLFLEETRRMYDLETLWTVGGEHDDLSQDVMDEVTTSKTLEDFSFDAELERLRRLRGYPDNDEQTAEVNVESMESQGNWHQK